MPTLPLYRPAVDPAVGPAASAARHPAVRLALPVAGVVAGTVAGFVAAAAIRRSGVFGPGWIDLVPKDGILEIDKGGARLSVSRGAHGSDAAARGEPPAGADEDAGDAQCVAATAIRPTFEVEEELAREIDREPDRGGGDEPAGRIDGEPDFDAREEPVLSATRA